MEEEQFRIILKGYGKDKGEYYIEEDFARLFKVSREKARELLDAAPLTIKENLSADAAKRYEAAIKNTGAMCEVENMKFDLAGLSLE